jgi:hypothetical protein
MIGLIYGMALVNGFQDIIRKEKTMPNWCQNEVNIYGYEGKGKKEIKHFLKTCFEKEEIVFEKIIPYPESAPSRDKKPGNMREWLDHPFSKWYSDFGYDWCVENWGTKWGASDQKNKLGDEELYLEFETAWSPPEGIHAKIKEMLPSCTIIWFYREDGVQISGWL